jgi:hypothetical protein
MFPDQTVRPPVCVISWGEPIPKNNPLPPYADKTLLPKNRITSARQQKNFYAKTSNIMFLLLFASSD